ncbi:capZ-interacting protein isoform X3 [Nerophis lumbriciformis]|uniref:capZ-interacting protein isoform X3 n=1 Tax=Nerophis lumbriciformis TaxID=546530 RepID=UPI002ADF3005|nr:capZ-interacting protein-like isoform X2 [Nerophis lumbriciformis]
MEDSPPKPSVAELAGMFKGHILPMPSAHDKSPRRRNLPPCSLKFPKRKNEADESKTNMAPGSPGQVRMKSPSVIERLQANLALSPTTLLPSPKSAADVNPRPESPPYDSSPAWGPLTPTLRPPLVAVEEDKPVGFNSPPEGTPLPSFTKTRARLSFRRRPPTRQHRKSVGEDTNRDGVFGRAQEGEEDEQHLTGEEEQHLTGKEEQHLTGEEEQHLTGKDEQHLTGKEEQDCGERTKSLPKDEGEEEHPSVSVHRPAGGGDPQVPH